MSNQFTIASIGRGDILDVLGRYYLVMLHPTFGTFSQRGETLERVQPMRWLEQPDSLSGYPPAFRFDFFRSCDVSEARRSNGGESS